ncbi:MAG: hypothetical protein NTZ87_03940 [Candidatus Nomurabacteria bacterium]|nr:hypothetical protein [Candidatus Nomurabacteria bacterium]
MPPEIKPPSNAEIEKALKEFEMQNGVPQAPQAQSVSKVYVPPDAPKMVQLVMKYSGGMIKEQKTAEYVLFGLAVLMFLASFYFFFK